MDETMKYFAYVQNFLTMNEQRIYIVLLLLKNFLNVEQITVL